MSDKDFLIEVYDPTPKGGQSVGRITASIKVTHIPTGMFAVATTERSQSRNKDLARMMVEFGLELAGYGNNPQ